MRVVFICVSYRYPRKLLQIVVAKQMSMFRGGVPKGKIMKCSIAAEKACATAIRSTRKAGFYLRYLTRQNIQKITCSKI